MIARCAEAKAAGAAGVGGDIASEGRGVLGGIGRVELIRSRGGGLQIAEENAGADDGSAGFDLEMVETGERNRPAVLRDGGSGDAGEGAHEGDGNLLLAGAAQVFEQLRLVAGNEDLVGLTGVERRVGDVGHLLSIISSFVHGDAEAKWMLVSSRWIKILAANERGCTLISAE